MVGTAHKLNRLNNLSLKLVNKKGKFIPYEFDLFEGNSTKICDLFDWIKNNVGLVQLVIGHIGHCGEFFMSEARAEFNCKTLNLTKVLTKATEELKSSNLLGCIIPVCILSPFFNANLSAAHLKYVAYLNNLRSEVEVAPKNITVSVNSNNCLNRKKNYILIYILDYWRTLRRRNCNVS